MYMEQDMYQQVDPYDRKVVEKIKEWERCTDQPSLFSRGVSAVTSPVREAVQPVLDKVGEHLADSPAARFGNEIFKGMVSFLSNTSAATVRTGTILREFRDKTGYGIYAAVDIERLSLAMVDQIVNGLAAKYRVAGVGEGAVAGSAGAGGLAADLPVLTTLALRAIGEYATYYGFDIKAKEERLYMLYVLSLACSLDSSAKYKVLTEMNLVASRIAQNTEWEAANKAVLLQSIKKIAEKFGDKLTKKKLMQIVPGIGAVIGAWSSSGLLADICEASCCVYRKRFLVRRYGAAVFEDGCEPVGTGKDPG